MSCYRPKPLQGFTLLEVLVALVIFSLITVGSYQVLRSLQQSHQALTKASQLRFSQQRALLLLRADLEQMLGRSARIEGNSERAPALLSNSDKLLEFTRTGFQASPAGLAVRRVAYQLEPTETGVALYRVVYAAVDRVASTPVFQQLLLDDVEAFSIRFTNSKGQWFDSWPPAVTNQEQAELALNDIPASVIVKLVLPGNISIEKFISLQ